MTGHLLNQGQMRAMASASLKVPEGGLVDAYIAGPSGSGRHAHLRQDARGLGRRLKDNEVLPGRAAGAKEVILAWTCPEKIQVGVTASGNPSMRVNPGTRHLDDEKAKASAVARPNMVIPDPVAGEVTAQVVAVRDHFATEMAKHGHTCDVAASVELRTERSKKVALELLMLPSAEVPSVSVLLRGRMGWDFFVKLMNDVRRLKVPMAGKRLVVLARARRIPDAHAAQALGALMQGATDFAHLMKRPYVPDEDALPDEPVLRAHGRRIYQRGRATYAPAHICTTDPLAFGPAADIPALLGTTAGWTIEQSRDEAYRLEVEGIIADLARMRSIGLTRTKIEYPALAPYLP